jgi:hypothetical protein
MSQDSERDAFFRTDRVGQILFAYQGKSTVSRKKNTVYGKEL